MEVSLAHAEAIRADSWFWGFFGSSAGAPVCPPELTRDSLAEPHPRMAECQSFAADARIPEFALVCAVSDEQHGALVLTTQRLNEFEHTRLIVGIEPGRRLV